MKTLALPWRILHWIIIVNLVIQVAYGAYMVFGVVTFESVEGPLATAAKQVPFELMATRRLYAIETWIAIVGLSVYLGLTEILPRRLKRD